MDNRDKNLLQNFKSYLKDHVIPTLSFRDGLREILQMEVIDNIFELRREEEIMSKLVDVLCKRDECAMKLFIILLRNTGHGFVADKLTEARAIDLVEQEAMQEEPIFMTQAASRSLLRSSTSFSNYSSRHVSAVYHGPLTARSIQVDDHSQQRQSAVGERNPTMLSTREPTDFCTVQEREQDRLENEERFNQMHERLDEHEDKVKVLEHRIKEKEDRLRESEMKIKRQEEEISILKEQSKRLSEERGQSDAQCLLAIERLKELEQEDIQLRAKNEILEFEVTKLQKQLDDVSTKATKAEKQRTTRDNEFIQLKNALQKEKQQNDRLRRQNMKLELHKAKNSRIPKT